MLPVEVQSLQFEWHRRTQEWCGTGKASACCSVRRACAQNNNNIACDVQYIELVVHARTHGARMSNANFYTCQTPITIYRCCGHRRLPQDRHSPDSPLTAYMRISYATCSSLPIGAMQSLTRLHALPDIVSACSCLTSTLRLSSKRIMCFVRHRQAHR
jgi:hypothetical protein